MSLKLSRRNRRDGWTLGADISSIRARARGQSGGGGSRGDIVHIIKDAKETLGRGLTAGGLTA